MLTVLTPASDTMLATIAALRLAAGLSADDESRDTELEALGLRLSAEIVVACRVAVGNGAEPTLRKERLEEKFRFPAGPALALARRHRVSIVSVDSDGVAVDADSYWVDEESGILRRLSSAGLPLPWRCRGLTVTYDAGFEEIPADLEGAVVDLARLRLASAARDPMVKGETSEVPDVMTTRVDYWVGSIPGSANTAIPADISARLSRYRNVRII